MSDWVYEASPARKTIVSPSSTATDRWPLVCPGVGKRWTSQASVRCALAIALIAQHHADPPDPRAG
jgi:hypothetical protein